MLFPCQSSQSFNSVTLPPLTLQQSTDESVLVTTDPDDGPCIGTDIAVSGSGRAESYVESAISDHSFRNFFMEDALRKRQNKWVSIANTPSIRELHEIFHDNDSAIDEIVGGMRSVLALTDASDETLCAKRAVMNFACTQDRMIQTKIFGSAPINLRLTDLSGMNLSGIDLAFADLSGANLTDVNLNEANLFGANLSGANLTRTNLCQTNLCWADLSHSNLTDAFLDAYLIRANLDNVVLNGVNLSTVSFTYAQCRCFVKDGETFAVCEDEIEFDEDADVFVDESTPYMFSMDWIRINTNGESTRFKWIDEYGNDTNEIATDRTRYIEVPRQFKNYRNNNFAHSNFAGSDFREVDFRGADVHDSDFRGANLCNANFGLDINCRDFVGSNIRNEIGRLIFENPNLKSANCRSCDFRWSNLRGVNFIGANLKAADFGKADLKWVNFSGADLRDVDFSGMDLRTVNFSGADLRGARFNGANLTGVNFSGAILADIDFSAAQLNEADFTGADLIGANFSAMDLVRVNFSGADLSEANFRNTALDRVKFTGADLRGAYLNVPVFRAANLPSDSCFDNAKVDPGIFELNIAPKKIVPVADENDSRKREMAIQNSNESELSRESTNVQSFHPPVTHRYASPPQRKGVPVQHRLQPEPRTFRSWMAGVTSRIGSLFRSIFRNAFRNF